MKFLKGNSINYLLTYSLRLGFSLTTLLIYPTFILYVLNPYLLGITQVLNVGIAIILSLVSPATALTVKASIVSNNYKLAKIKITKRLILSILLTLTILSSLLIFRYLGILLIENYILLTICFLPGYLFDFYKQFLIGKGLATRLNVIIVIKRIFEIVFSVSSYLIFKNQKIFLITLFAGPSISQTFLTLFFIFCKAQKSSIAEEVNSENDNMNSINKFHKSNNFLMPINTLTSSMDKIFFAISGSIETLGIYTIAEMAFKIIYQVPREMTDQFLYKRFRSSEIKKNIKSFSKKFLPLIRGYQIFIILVVTLIIFLNTDLDFLNQIKDKYSGAQSYIILFCLTGFIASKRIGYLLAVRSHCLTDENKKLIILQSCLNASLFTLSFLVFGVKGLIFAKLISEILFSYQVDSYEKSLLIKKF